jgi:glycogen operon protein
MGDAGEQVDGAPAPLGARWIAEEGAYNFALYSNAATAVTLLLYGAADFATPLAALPFVFPNNKTGRIWHRRVLPAEAGAAVYYAYRVEGPFDPARGLRCDPEKILLDPYARLVFFPPGHSRAAACTPGSNAGRAPLGLLPPRAPAARPDPRHGNHPRHDHDLVICELHVRGFTRAAADLPEAARGTFAGVIAKIPYLQSLGVTAVELMPVHQFDPQEGNYWGYMTLNFFAPHAAYGSDGTPAGAAAEFRRMADALHAAGIEVILDVVYNHTTEMGEGGPVYSFRGIDNAGYYALDPSDRSKFFNFSACGNDLNTAHPAVRRLVLDSLRFWVREMGVDGFRFDLASIFARDESGALNLVDPPIISEITTDPTLAHVRLIAEPWQGSPDGGYLMGRQFPGHTWRQWNDHFRDTVRRFVRGDPGLVGALMTRLYGSTDLFGDDLASACRRGQSLNYVASHDGLTLYDLVAYTDAGQNSWNSGHEGEGAPPEVTALRRQQVKNFCCLLMLANGTPMFMAGDEGLRSQGGNANAWNQDNAASWLDWSRVVAEGEMVRFFTRMIALRRAHPTIGRGTGWRNDITWYGPTGGPDLGPEGHTLAYHLRGAAGEGDLYVMVNNAITSRDFSIQAPGRWVRLIDTARASPDDAPDAPPAVGAGTYAVAARSVVVLATGSGVIPA